MVWRKRIMSIETIADALEEGLVVIDQDEKIKVFNKSAKEITGIIYDNSLEHPSGRINKGDYVLIADINLGEDDGNLSYRGLELIGIRDKRIAKGTTILAIGRYGLAQANYKFFSQDLAFNEFNLEDRIDALISRPVSATLPRVFFSSLRWPG